MGIAHTTLGPHTVSPTEANAHPHFSGEESRLGGITYYLKIMRPYGRELKAKG